MYPVQKTNHPTELVLVRAWSTPVAGSVPPSTTPEWNVRPSHSEMVTLLANRPVGSPCFEKPAQSLHIGIFDHRHLQPTDPRVGRPRIQHLRRADLAIHQHGSQRPRLVELGFLGGGQEGWRPPDGAFRTTTDDLGDVIQRDGVFLNQPPRTFNARMRPAAAGVAAARRPLRPSDSSRRRRRPNPGTAGTRAGWGCRCSPAQPRPR